MQQAPPVPLEVDTREGSSEHVATVLPGRGYTCDAPLLHHTRLLLRTRGFSVRTVRWPTPPTPARLLDLAPGLLDPVRARQHLLIAKSLSTRLLPLAVDRGLPGVWLTPLLGEPTVRDAAQRASAPTLLIGGSADPYWDAAAARQSGQRVLEVAGADHSIEVPGEVTTSLRALQTVVTEIEDFLDTLS